MAWSCLSSPPDVGLTWGGRGDTDKSRKIPHPTHAMSFGERQADTFWGDPPNGFRLNPQTKRVLTPKKRRATHMSSRRSWARVALFAGLRVLQRPPGRGSGDIGEMSLELRVGGELMVVGTHCTFVLITV